MALICEICGSAFPSSAQKAAAPNAAVPDDEIGYAFSTGDRDSIQWVLSRRVIAAAVDNLTYEEALRQGARDLIVLGETERILRHHLVLFRPGMDPTFQAAVKTLLLNLQETEEAQSLLARSETVRFSEISPADEAGLRRARELYDLVGGR